MSLNISASGISAALGRQQVTANNIANLNSSGYRAGIAQIQEAPAGGAQLGPVQRSEAAAVLQFTGNPADQAAGLEGFAEGSNVNLATEAVDTKLNTNLLRANVGAFRAQDEALGALLDIVG